MTTASYHIGLAIKHLADKKKCSVESLAQKLGVVRQSVYDTFERDSVRKSTVKKYASALGVTEEEIYQVAGFRTDVLVDDKALNTYSSGDGYLLKRLADLEDMVVFLKAQLTEKDNQIRTLLGKSDSVFLAGFVPLFFLVFGYKFGYTY